MWEYVIISMQESEYGMKNLMFRLPCLKKGPLIFSDSFLLLLCCYFLPLDHCYFKKQILIFIFAWFLFAIKQKNLRAVVWGEAEAQDTFLAITQWAQNAISKFHVGHYVCSETSELTTWQCQIHKLPWCIWENRYGLCFMGWKHGLPSNISILIVSVELHLTLFP